MEKNETIYLAFKIVQKRKWSFFLAFLTTLLAGAALSLIQPQLYETNARFLFETSPSVSLLNAGLTQETLKTNTLHKLFEITQSKDAVVEIIDKLMLNADPNKILANLSVQAWEKDAPFIQISLKGENPLVISTFLQGYAEYLIASSERVFKEYMTSVQEFLDTQVNGTQKNIQTLESKIKDLQESEKILSISDEMAKLHAEATSLKKELSGIENEEQSSKASLTGLQQKIDRLRKGKKTGSSQSSHDWLLRQSLTAIETDFTGLSASFFPNPLKMGELKQKISSLKNKLRDGFVKTTVDQSGEKDHLLRASLEESLKLEMSLKILAGRKAYLANHIKSCDRTFLRLSEQNASFSDLLRQKHMFEQSLTTLIDRQNQMNLQKQTLKGKFHLVAKPAVPELPLQVHRQTHILITVFLAIFMGFLMAEMAEYLDPILHSCQEVQTHLPLFPKGLFLTLKGKKNDSPIASNVESSLCTLSNPFSPEADRFKAFRTNLLHLHKQEPFKSLFIASSTPNSESSEITANIAISLAMAGFHVILVDSNWRQPRQQSLFRIPNTKGLTNLLTGTDWKEIAQTTALPNLLIVTSGPLPPNPSEIFASNRFEDLLSFLKSKADFVLFDGPPIGHHSDSLVLAPKMDKVFFMVSLGLSEKSEVTMGYHTLREIHCPLAGLIIHQVPVHELRDFTFTS